MRERQRERKGQREREKEKEREKERKRGREKERGRERACERESTIHAGGSRQKYSVKGQGDLDTELTNQPVFFFRKFNRLMSSPV